MKNAGNGWGNGWVAGSIIPIGSMYGIFTYIWVILGVNVGKYSIHGASGDVEWTGKGMVFFGNPWGGHVHILLSKKKLRKTPTHQGSRDITCSWKRYDLSIFLTTRQHPTIKMAGKNIPTNLRTGHHSIVVSLLCPVSAWVVPLILTSLTWNILGVLYLNKRIIYYKVAVRQLCLLVQCSPA